MCHIIRVSPGGPCKHTTGAQISHTNQLRAAISQMEAIIRAAYPRLYVACHFASDQAPAEGIALFTDKPRSFPVVAATS